MRASLERLYVHLSDISIRLARADKAEDIKPASKKSKTLSKKDDVRINVAKSLERLQADRAAYIEALKDKIARGEYKVSAEEVAARILGVIDDV
ncbi:hypothetical protein GM182_05675 [bacterium 3DAC]|jgi:anti-sigma28 factor (negative regulator of flagellin synthesis)|nr:flagellar biosynthesis anti-sigma factor FlgM [Dictyoglomota bacterium]UZN23354.1 hypothetical protein GM182_05675 [bacterium 3DAC]